ncbi:MAG: cardiolipin synthase [Elusimicrobia bacterium]|nr:cardiolipin synthase [Elusimicrobiota bacterium]
MRRPFGALLLAAAIAASGCSSLNFGKRIRKPVDAAYSIEDAAFRDSLGNLVNAPFLEGNKVTELLNGDQIFPAMVEAIKGAKKTITLEQYIWSSGKVSDMFVPAICERARAGVKVLVLVDAFGSGKLHRKDVKQMTDAGVEFRKYNPPILTFHLFGRDQRSHRKLLIVDGRVGFIGGVCMSDEWLGNAQPKHWRDTHFRVEGPVVGQIQAIFASNWLQMTGKVIEGPDYFPHLEKAGDMVAQAVESGPRQGREDARLTYLMAFAAAKKSIRIEHAYFAPDAMVIQALKNARKRGVRVEVIFPEKLDNVLVRKASWAYWKDLLEAGVQFYEYEPTLLHCKIVIVDDVFTIAGSVNFDERSLRLNDEANLDVLDKDFAKTMTDTFEEDKKKCKALKMEDFKKRSPLNRLTDHFIGIFRSQL